MGEMLRSDRMTFCDMFLQPEAAFEILSQIGEMGCVQFIDVNPDAQAFQKRYISEVCRCADMERILRYIEGELAKDNIDRPYPKQEPKAMQPNEMVMFENMFEKWEDDIAEMSQNQTNLMKTYLQVMEMNYVLTHIGPLLGDAEIAKESLFTNRKKIKGDIGPGGRLVVMTGVVRRHKSFHFEMMLWRISRGNIYYRQATQDKILSDPVTGKELRKVAFLAVCQGEQLRKRMEKVCTGFRVNIYACPQTLQERANMLSTIGDRISDLEEVLKKTKSHRCKALRTVGRQWYGWMIQVRKAKAIYHTLNKFSLDITKNCLIGQCWVPDRDLQRIQDTLEYCSTIIGTNVPSFMSKTGTVAVPPTFHRTNKFTRGFQVLIHAYGDSKYRELNPGLFTLITFPFLFGLMFGDIGHGFIIVIFASWMIIKEKKLDENKSKHEIWNILFCGRYVILLLGLFSVYAGFIYNDCFSKSLAIRSSYYKNQYTDEELAKENYLYLDPRGKYGIPYPFSIDPVWTLSTNRIMIENGIKMKLSIIFGVTHMIFGVILSFFNHVHFKNYYAIPLQFIPQLVFLCSLFLWLVFMIYYKWFIYSARHPDAKRGSACAPQILILFIDMVLLSTTKHQEESCDAYMFPAQQTLQLGLVIVAVCCVPVLLLGTPLYIHHKNEKIREEAKNAMSNFRRYQRSTHRDVDKQMEEVSMAETAIQMSSFTDLLISEAVNTIEFVLSTVSHTASYLRLWALSLAHAQLSEMLWHMILSKLALQEHSYLGVLKLFIIFAIWATFSLTILVIMEGLSAFLHTLRLHWVEFMSKFYVGGGYPFMPFSFKALKKLEADKLEGGCHTRHLHKIHY